MKNSNIKKLQMDFVGKICTILTAPIAKSTLLDAQFADYFTCLIDQLDEDGIWATHPTTGCKNFYSFQHIVGLIEEQVFYENNPEHAEIIRQAKEISKKPTDSPYVNIDLMTDLVKQTKGT